MKWFNLKLKKTAAKLKNNPPKQVITVREKTPVQIGQPAVYPAEIVRLMKNLFTFHKSVQKAYVGWIYQPDSGLPPHYIFLLDGNDIPELVFDEAGRIAMSFLDDNNFVDFMRTGPENQTEGIGYYFLTKTQPFYDADIYTAAHRFCSNHYTAITQDKRCGCFYCRKTFAPEKIKKWIRDKEGLTALCPYCGIDTVLGESSGYSLTDDFLREMQNYWFQDVGDISYRETIFS